ncbi:MAG: hypothetical protein V7700_15660 [Halioglobus sp.]
MITLHGFPYSNYHNIVKHALMYKGIAFEERIVYPNTPEMMADSDISRKIDADHAANADEFMAYVRSRTN